MLWVTLGAHACRHVQTNLCCYPLLSHHTVHQSSALVYAAWWDLKQANPLTTLIDSDAHIHKSDSTSGAACLDLGRLLGREAVVHQNPHVRHQRAARPGAILLRSQCGASAHACTGTQHLS